MQLPSFYLICPRPACDVQDYINKFELYIAAGIRLFQLRFGADLLYQKYATLVKELLHLATENGAKLLINSTLECAIETSGHGVHLNSSRLMKLEKPLFYRDFILATSCHNIKELEHACRVKADFAVLSPVKKTISHPLSDDPLGWRRFGDLVKNLSIPVYALGGMQPEDLQQSHAVGAHGIAVLSAAAWHEDKANINDFLDRYSRSRRSME